MMAEKLPVYTPEELQKCNGENGNPVYIAYQGRVYDVSESKLWRKGTHVKRHSAGYDLTGHLVDSPHGEEVFERYPHVGFVELEEKTELTPEEEYEHLPGFVARFIARHPFFERHPHPMTVHFPIVFMIAAPVFALLYLITDVRGFEITTFYMLGGAALFSLAAIATGYITWWINYMARALNPVIWKIVLSSIGFLISAGAFIWRLIDSSVLENLLGFNVIYLILVLTLFPLVSVIGWIGATLTFPLPEKKKSEKKE